MSSGLQNQKMLELGGERLKLLGNHAELLMDAYIRGEFDETAVGERVLQKLIQARILWRPDDAYGLKLRPQIASMVAGLIADESRRQAHADVSGELDRIEATAISYTEAQHKGNYSYADLQLQLLTEAVYDLTGQFEDAIDSLWQRLNSHFGFVASLTDKIRENELAHKQIHRLLEGLELVRVDEMITLAGTSSELRKLLVVYLNQKLSVHHASLLAVQERMTELLTRFRAQQERSLLVSGMAAYLRQHPDFEPGDYSWRAAMPDLLNQANPLVPAVSIAIDRASDAEAMAELVNETPVRTTRMKRLQEVRTKPAAVIHGETAALQVKQERLKHDVESFFLSVLAAGKGKPTAALDYLEQQKLNWDSEIWLYQVISEYQGLPVQERNLFRLVYIEKPVSYFNQVQLVKDIELQFMADGAQ